MDTKHDNIKQIRAAVDAAFDRQKRERAELQQQISALHPRATLIADKLHERCVRPRYVANAASPANVAAELAAITRASARADDFVTGCTLMLGPLDVADLDEWGKRGKR